MSRDESTNDPLNMIDALQEFAENLRGMVAVFVAEGFTDAQARELVVYTLTQAAKAQS